MNPNETDNFEAFDSVASALAELDLYEASIRTEAAEAKKDSHKSNATNGEEFTAASAQVALNNAIGHLKDALNENPDNAGTEHVSSKERRPKGDPDYFKAHYLQAMTEYFSDRPDVAADLFKRILDPKADRGETDFDRAAGKARANANKDFLEEVRYNLGAAYLEQDNLQAAIDEFSTVIKATENRDVSLALLARSAKALALSYKGESPKARAQLRKIRWEMVKDAIFLFRFGWRDGVIIRKRAIDERTAQSIRRIRRQIERELAGKSVRRRPPKVPGTA